MIDKLWRRREELLKLLNQGRRYIACARVMQRQIFEFISTTINPNDKVMAFVFEDDYTFGIIQSNIHWTWFLEKCTTLGETPNYNTAAIWDTFVFPQHPTQKQAETVAKSAVALRAYRNKMIQQHSMTLRDLYTSIETPGKNPLKDFHAALDEAVIQAYGFSSEKDILEQLLQLNLEVWSLESKEKEVTPPGLPSWIKNRESFVTEDCVKLKGEEDIGMFKK